MGVGYVLLALVLVAAGWLGIRALKWHTTSIVLTTSRILERRGVFTRQGIEIRLDRVNELSYRQTLLERMVHTGSLEIEVGGETGVSLQPPPASGGRPESRDRADRCNEKGPNRLADGTARCHGTGRRDRTSRLRAARRGFLSPTLVPATLVPATLASATHVSAALVPAALLRSAHVPATGAGTPTGGSGIGWSDCCRAPRATRPAAPTRDPLRSGIPDEEGRVAAAALSRLASPPSRTGAVRWAEPSPLRPHAHTRPRF